MVEDPEEVVEDPDETIEDPDEVIEEPLQCPVSTPHYSRPDLLCFYYSIYEGGIRNALVDHCLCQWLAFDRDCEDTWDIQCDKVYSDFNSGFQKIHDRLNIVLQSVDHSKTLLPSEELKKISSQLDVPTR